MPVATIVNAGDESKEEGEAAQVITDLSLVAHDKEKEIFEQGKHKYKVPKEHLERFWQQCIKLGMDPSYAVLMSNGQICIIRI